MKKIKTIFTAILLANLIISFAGISQAETLPKWVKVITGKVLSIDTKYNRLTIEFKEKKLLKTNDIKLTLNIWRTYKPTEILVDNERGSLEDIKEGDTIKVIYEVTASAGNVAIKIEALTPR